jgi:hypothetical protein
MMDTNEIEVRTLRDHPLDEQRFLLANFAHGSLYRSYDRSLSFPLQHFFVEYLERDGWEASDSTLHIVSMMVGAVMFP